MANIRCDGCETEVEARKMVLVKDYGHQVRYCPLCVDIYRDYVLQCEAHEQEMQRELDTWVVAERQKLLLQLCPMDLRLTAVRDVKTEEGIILG